MTDGIDVKQSRLLTAIQDSLRHLSQRHEIHEHKGDKPQAKQ